MGKRLKPPAASTCFMCADWHPPRHPHFFIDLRGSSHSQTSLLELHSGKMPKVPKAGSKRSPLAEVHDERRKGRKERALQGEELEWAAKREGKERGTTTENV